MNAICDFRRTGTRPARDLRHSHPGGAYPCSPKEILLDRGGLLPHEPALVTGSHGFDITVGFTDMNLYIASGHAA
jgi:hypothetical protein